jgi:UDP-glucose 4-epimerase
LKNFEEAERAVRDAANPEVRVSTTNPEIHFNENVVATFNLLKVRKCHPVTKANPILISSIPLSPSQKFAV